MDLAPNSLRWRALAVLLGASLVACGSEPAAPLAAEPTEPNVAPSAERPSFVLVVVDTLRADALGSYGADGRATPFLDELAQRSVVFADATSSSSHTVPSVSSILTGLHPHRHGNHYYAATNSFRVPERRVRPALPDGVPHIADLFRAAGYATAAVVTNPWLRAEYGFARGFDRYRLMHSKEWSDHPRGDIVLAEVERLLAGELRAGPFLLYLHYMDVHPPFEPRSSARELFTGGLTGSILPRRYGQQPDASDDDIAFTRALYAASVRELDDHLRRLSARLSRDLRSANTWLVITADHGEELLEHGGFGHGFQLQMEVVRVPLLFSHPSVEPLRAAIPTSNVDVLPTLLELAELPLPDVLDGISLAPAIRGAGLPPAANDRLIVTELGPILSLRRGSKTIHRRRDALAVEGERPWASELRRALEALLGRGTLADADDPKPAEPDRELQSRLRALGYVDELPDERVLD